MYLPIRPSGQSENISPLDRIGGSSKIKASSSFSPQTVASSTVLADVVNTSDHDVLPVPEQAKPTTGRQPSLTASPVASSSVDNRTVVALRSPPSDASVTDDHSVVVTICGVNQEDRTLEEALEEAFCPPAYDLGLDFEDPLFWPSEKVSIGLKDVKWDGPGDFQTPDAISPDAIPIPFRSKRTQMHQVGHPTFYQGDDTGHSMIHVETPYTASTSDSSRPSKRPRCNDEESGEEATSSASEPALPHTPKRQRLDASTPAAAHPAPTLVPAPVYTPATAPPSPRAPLASPESLPSFTFLPLPACAPAPLPTGPAVTLLVPMVVPALVPVSAHVPASALASAAASGPAPAQTRQSAWSCNHCRHNNAKHRCAQYPTDENGGFKKNDGPGPQNPPCRACIELGQSCWWTRRKRRVDSVPPPTEEATGPVYPPA